MNIYEKMLKATEQIGNVAKNLEVGVGKNQYKAVGELDVLKAVKPIEVELGIYSYPLSRKIIDTNTFTTTSEYQGKTTERSNLFMRLETVYRFVNVEKPEEFVDITTYGDGVDTQDKAPGKAMTYSDKYALLKAYKIGTGDDPDQNASQEGKFKNKAQEPTQEEIEVIENKPLQEFHVKTLEEEMKRTGIQIKQFPSDCKVANLKELNLKQFKRLMTLFEPMENKKQTNLDL